MSKKKVKSKVKAKAKAKIRKVRAKTHKEEIYTGMASTINNTLKEMQIEKVVESRTNPTYYSKQGSSEYVELIDAIVALPGWKFNAIKYIFRAGEKTDNIDLDLDKALVYIEYGRRLAKREPISETLRHKAVYSSDVEKVEGMVWPFRKENK